MQAIHKSTKLRFIGRLRGARLALIVVADHLRHKTSQANTTNGKRLVRAATKLGSSARRTPNLLATVFTSAHIETLAVLIRVLMLIIAIHVQRINSKNEIIGVVEITC
jgi:hypothetical protein